MGRSHQTTEATGAAPKEMGRSIQFVLIFSLFSLFPGSQGQGEICCPTKVVTNSPDGSGLDGTYNLKEDEGEDNKREDICIDGCVYERDGLEYCFISKPVAEAAQVDCDDSGFTGSSTTGSTGTGSTMSPVSMDSTEPTEPTGFTGSTGSTGSSGPTTTQSMEDLAAAAAKASEDAAAALAAMAAADEAIGAASAAADELTSINLDKFGPATTTAGRRLRRQDASTTTAYIVPTTA